MTDTLMLNADGQPLSVIPLSRITWQESIKMLWEETADPIIFYEGWVVRSPSIELKVPSVMMLRDYIKVNRGVKFSRSNVYLRDNFTCQYCGLNLSGNPGLLTLDHVIPRSRNGKTNWTNIVSACCECNLRKAHHDLMKPKTKPVQPDYYQLVSRRQALPISVPDERWITFIGWKSDLVHVTHHRKQF